MARKGKVKKVALSKKNKPATHRSFRLSKSPTLSASTSSFVSLMQRDLKTNQPVVSLALGILIVIILAVSIFNFVTKPSPNLGPSSQTYLNSQKTATKSDVSKDNLPGKYTIKDGDTLFQIAQNYYGNGDNYSKIAQANNIQDADLITTGQIITIPKPQNPTPTSQTSLQGNIINPSPDPTPTQNTGYVVGGTGGSVNETEWGASIAGTTYTVEQGDWLSKIAGRAYGDIYQYTKIAAANNISDPNQIEPGTVLQIPR